MNIGILSQNKEKNITGINRVTMGTVTELLKLDKKNNYYFVGNSDWLNIPLESIPALPDIDCAMRLNYTVNAYPLDIIHSHYRAFELNPGFPCAKILTMHDLIPLLYPQWYGGQYDYFNEVLRKCAHSADLVIAVSQYTQNDIVKHYGIKEEKIKDWIVDEGIFREKKLDDNADFHYIIEFPNDNIMDVVRPKGKDFVLIACATQVSPQHLELMNNSSSKERSDFLLDVNMAINQFLVDCQLAVDQNTNLLQQYVITYQIFDDGITKNTLFDALKRVFKSKIQCVWLIEKTFGTVQNAPTEPSNENSMFI